MLCLKLQIMVEERETTENTLESISILVRSAEVRYEASCSTTLLKPAVTFVRVDPVGKNMA